MEPMATLRDWLRQLIDEPNDTSLDVLMRLREEPAPRRQRIEVIRDRGYLTLGAQAPPTH